MHKFNFLNWLYMNEEWCIVFARDTFFRKCCKCLFRHFHYTTHGIEVSFFYAKSRTCSFIEQNITVIKSLKTGEISIGIYWNGVMIMEFNINSPVYFKDHYGIDDEVYKFCQRAYLFFKDKNLLNFWLSFHKLVNADISRILGLYRYFLFGRYLA